MYNTLKVNPFSILYLASFIILTGLILNKQVVLAGTVLTLIFCLAFVFCLFQDSPAGIFTMTILVFSPFLAFLRQYVISYNGTSMILLSALLLWFLMDRGSMLRRTLLDRRIFIIIVFVVIFVIYGLLTGAPLSRFMKFVETVLTVILFSMALRNFLLVRKHMIYYIISSMLIVVSLLPHIEARYIFAVGDETVKADPSIYSIGLVLSAFFLTEEDGHWVFLYSSRAKKVIRYSLLVAVVILTFLTTSRVGFFVLIGSYMVFFLFRRANIKSIAPLVLAVLLSVVFISNSKYSDASTKWFKKTFKNERGLSAASTGRSDQYKMAGFYLVSADIKKVLFGYNPGKGPQFSLEYSRKADVNPTMVGKAMQLHSLYLNILIEFGLISFVIFIFFLIKSWERSFTIFKLYGNTIPFLTIIAYTIYIGSVSGLGIIPGMFISLFLMSPDNLVDSKIETNAED